MNCQYCATAQGVKEWIPGGRMCGHCHKALARIRLMKCGVPMPRMSKEMHEALEEGVFDDEEKDCS